MAVKTLTPVKEIFNTITEFAFETATSATDGFTFAVPSRDGEMVILVTNTDAETAYDITLKKPVSTTAPYAAASADVKHELAAGEFAMIRVETAKFGNTDGTINLVPENVAVKAVVIY